MTKEAHQGFERSLQTASDKQLQIALLELQTSLMTVFTEPDVIAEVTRGLGEAMVGINVADIPVHHRLEDRGW